MKGDLHIGVGDNNVVGGSNIESISVVSTLGVTTIGISSQQTIFELCTTENRNQAGNDLQNVVEGDLVDSQAIALVDAHQLNG